MLTNERIEELATRKGVKGIAVRNFLMSVGANADERDARMNMVLDADLYKWNAATVKAIRQGIAEYFDK